MLELVLPNCNGAIGPAKVYRKEVCLMFCKIGVVMHGKTGLYSAHVAVFALRHLAGKC